MAIVLIGHLRGCGRSSIAYHRKKIHLPERKLQCTVQYASFSVVDSLACALISCARALGPVVLILTPLHSTRT